MVKKRDSLSDDDANRIRDEIEEDLSVYDLNEWQKACKSFAPVHYESETRREWYDKNKFRLESAKEITEFVEVWVKSYRQNDDFEDYTVSAIREAVIEAIRYHQVKEGAELGLLNPVKLNGFKTLVKWATNQSLLDEGPYEGATKIPEGQARKTKSRRTSRKKLMGKYGPPIVNLAEDYHVLDEDHLQLNVTIENWFIHPYQNVNLILDVDPMLSVTSVSQFSWSPMNNTIPIGFLASSLGENPMQLRIDVTLAILSNAPEYSISGSISYDDCEKGEHTVQELGHVSLKLV